MNDITPLDKEINELISEACKSAHEQFKAKMLEKRNKFFERVHAAFVLNTFLTEFGILSEDNLSWLRNAYPKSIIKTGTDQGAIYYTIIPK